MEQSGCKGVEMAEGFGGGGGGELGGRLNGGGDEKYFRVEVPWFKQPNRRVFFAQLKLAVDIKKKSSRNPGNPVLAN